MVCYNYINDFTGHNLDVEYYLYKREIESAKASGYIDEDWNILWDGTKDMRSLIKSLEELEKCIESLDEDSYIALEEEYDTLDINNLSFWNNALNASITS